MSRPGFLSLLLLITLLALGIPAASAQYAIPDCFIARVNSTFPQEEFWAARDAWYRELSGEWDAQVAGLTPEQLTAYTAVFCNTLVVRDGGDSEDGQSRIVEWSYQPVESWLAETGGHVPATDTTGGSSNSNAAAGSSGVTTPDTASNTGSQASASSNSAAPAEIPLFSTDFNTMPNEVSVIDPEGNTAASQIINSNGDSALRVKASDFISLYYEDDTLTDYALEIETRIHSGEIILTVRGGDDFCSGYEFNVYPGIDYASLSVNNADCNPTILSEVYELSLENGAPMTLRLEANGSQLTASINGEALLSAEDDTYSRGYATVYFMSEIVLLRDALIDVSAMRVVPVGGPAETRLTQHTAAHGQAIAELQALGVVPEGHATFIFQEPTAYFEGDGSWYTPLAQSAPHTDIVIAGSLEVTFNAPSEYETCFIMTRVVTQGGTAVQELSVGLDSQGDVLMIDRDDPDATDLSTFEVRPLAGDVNASHHFLLVARGSYASLYVDGQLYFDRVKVDERAGTYGVGLSSYDGDSRCEANNLWLYSFD